MKSLKNRVLSDEAKTSDLDKAAVMRIPRIMITKSHNHDHFWSENNIVYESYNTIRGLRFRQIIELDFNYPNHEKLTDTMITFLNNILKSKN